MRNPLKMTNYSKEYPNLREHENLKLNPMVKIVKLHGKTTIELILELKSNYNPN